MWGDKNASLIPLFSVLICQQTYGTPDLLLIRPDGASLPPHIHLPHVISPITSRTRGFVSPAAALYH